MLCDIKNELGNPTVRKLVSESAFDKSTEAMDRKAAEFQRREDLHLYGWFENNEILGVCGVEVHSKWVVIHNIAVDPKTRKNGIGKAMINAVQQKYKTAVEAETDDDAVEFYRKCGFETKGFMKTYNSVEYQRYRCVLRFN
ncbi:MAG: GNAT family N-acetyltransferase [Oscillospiraceae bacterium]|nr:GNAT family N-acetyltransferase [Oscillospiraceae bacterium]